MAVYSVPSAVAAQVEHMLLQGSSMKLQISPVPGVLPRLPQPGGGSRMEAPPFVLDFEYCMQVQRWQVLFQRLGSNTWVPDFIIPARGFQPLQGPGGQTLKSVLSTWDSCDETALYRLLMLLLESFREWQAMRVAAAAAGNSRLQFELDTMGDSGLQVMLTEPSQVDGRWAILMVPLEGVNFNPLEAMLNPQQQPAPPLNETRSARTQNLPLPSSSAPPPRSTSALTPSAAAAAVVVDDSMGRASSLPTPNALIQDPTPPALQRKSLHPVRDNIQAQPHPAGHTSEASPSAHPPSGTFSPSGNYPAVAGDSGAAADPHGRDPRDPPDAVRGNNEGGINPRVLETPRWLQIAYPVGSRNGGAPSVQLSLPPSLESVIGPPKLPVWSDGTCLLEYMPAAVEALQAQVEAVARSHALRKTLLYALAETVGQLIYLDSTSYWGASYSMQQQELTCIVHVALLPGFPGTMPHITLTGATARTRGHVKELVDYRWSPRWDAAEMARRLCASLVEALPSWKEGAVRAELGM